MFNKQSIADFIAQKPKTQVYISGGQLKTYTRNKEGNAVWTEQEEEILVKKYQETVQGEAGRLMKLCAVLKNKTYMEIKDKITYFKKLKKI
jgi:hypothetical protein